MAEIISRYIRGESRAAAISKMECFVIIVNDFQPLTIITKRSILDVAAALDPLLNCPSQNFNLSFAKDTQTDYESVYNITIW